MKKNHYSKAQAQADEINLEDIMDRMGMLGLLTLLECLCAEKCISNRADSGDKALGKQWEAASKAFGKAARHASILSLEG